MKISRITKEGAVVILSRSEIRLLLAALNAVGGDDTIAARAKLYEALDAALADTYDKENR